MLDPKTRLWVKNGHMLREAAETTLDIFFAVNEFLPEVRVKILRTLEAGRIYQGGEFDDFKWTVEKAGYERRPREQD